VCGLADEPPRTFFLLPGASSSRGLLFSSFLSLDMLVGEHGLDPLFFFCSCSIAVGDELAVALIFFFPGAASSPLGESLVFPFRQAARTG